MINIQDSTIILLLIMGKFEKPALFHEKETFLTPNLIFNNFIFCVKSQYGLPNMAYWDKSDDDHMKAYFQAVVKDNLLDCCYFIMPVGWS